MRRILILTYGAVAYGLFLVTFLYAIGFIVGLGVPKSINDGAIVPVEVAIAIDIALLGLFGLQHSIMARRGFKAWWTKIIPAEIERSTFVLVTCAVLGVIFWQWRPLPESVWSVSSTAGQIALWTTSTLGWLVVLVSTWIIDHFELFGLRQTWSAFRGKSARKSPFRVSYFYRFVRHPLMFGFLVAFWSTPHMTQGQLLFAVVVTAYILVALRLEERDLVAVHGDDYVEYRRRVPMLIPRLTPARCDEDLVTESRGAAVESL
jgi:protein-S-isoprenylcysteine O-methyltransferase Ste14